VTNTSSLLLLGIGVDPMFICDCSFDNLLPEEPMIIVVINRKFSAFMCCGM
jgi:hypothetical protein